MRGLTPDAAGRRLARFVRPANGQAGAKSQCYDRMRPISSRIYATTAATGVFRSVGSNIRQWLEVNSFASDRASKRQFFVWNTSFPWQPEVKYVSADAPVVERRGWAYLSNTSIAPALENDRHRLREWRRANLSWAKQVAAPVGFGNDQRRL